MRLTNTLINGLVIHGEDDRIKHLASPDDIELFLRGTDAINRLDVSAVLEFVDEETVFEPLRSGTEGAFVGRDGMRRFLADTAETFALFKVSYTDVRKLRDGRLLAIGTIRIRGLESGVEADVGTAAIVKLRDGVLAHYKDYGDVRLALEAADVSP